MAGIFITFEGPDGAGKTSVLNEIIEKISNKLGPELVVTREPGGTHIAEAIRNVILDTKNTAMDARTEALLFAAARRQHLTEIIKPALAADKFVFCDRFVDSSVAYQGAGREIGAAEVWEMNKFATEGLMPDLTLYFDVPSEVGLARIKNFRSDEINRLDQASLSFHRRVRNAYLNLQATYPERIVLIDATKSFEAVVADAIKVITQRYPVLDL